MKKEVRKTLLVVGEGDSEEAFLKHLRSLYCSGGRGPAVTVRNAHGKGPEHVIDHARRLAQQFDFDRYAALLDTDLPWTASTVKTAAKYRISMLGAEPCLEGLLLKILAQPVPPQSAQCKQRMSAMGLDLTSSSAYGDRFNQDRLESARTRIEMLESLLALFEGRWD